VPLLMMAAVGMLAVNFNVLLPLVATRVFHGSASLYGALYSMMGVGALCGALYSANRARPTLLLLAGAATMFGTCLLLAAGMPILPLEFIVLIPLGMAMTVYQAGTNSSLQLHAKPEFRGRIVALYVLVQRHDADRGPDRGLDRAAVGGASRAGRRGRDRGPGRRDRIPLAAREARAPRPRESDGAVLSYKLPKGARRRLTPRSRGAFQPFVVARHSISHSDSRPSVKVGLNAGRLTTTWTSSRWPPSAQGGTASKIPVTASRVRRQPRSWTRE
jgi:hypothetical protein